MLVGRWGTRVYSLLADQQVILRGAPAGRIPPPALRPPHRRHRSSIWNWVRAKEEPGRLTGMAENLCGREWEFSTLGRAYFQSKNNNNKASQFQGIEFSIMSYNILAQSLLEDNRYLYTNCQPKDLHWDNRRYRILQELRFYQPDVVCVQEMERAHFNNDLKAVFESMGYHCIFHSRTGDKHDGCLLMFKRDKFRCHLARPVSYFRPGVSVLDRDNVAIVAVLNAVNPQYRDLQVCIATTHLLFNPRRGEIKLAQLVSLFAEVNQARQLTKDSAPISCIICGDFNSLPGSPLYQFVTDGSLQYTNVTKSELSGQEDNRNSTFIDAPLLPPSLAISDCCNFLDKSEVEEMFTFGTELRHDLNLSSVHQHKCLKNGQREVTTFHGRAQETVDYIFFSHDDHNKKSSYLSPLARLSLLCEEDLEYLGGLPNKLQPSDHIPLFASFFLSAQPPKQTLTPN